MLKNVTFAVDSDQLDDARKKAKSMKTTLQELFREWLAGYVSGEVCGSIEQRLDRLEQEINSLKNKEYDGNN